MSDKMLRFQVVLVIALLLVSNAQADDWTSASKPGDGSIFTFRGLKIGDPIPKRFAQAPRGTYELHKTYCMIDQHGVLDCYDAIGDRKPQSKQYPDSPWLGDVPVSQLIFRFFEGKFCGFYITFDESRFDTLKTMLQAKYGTPDRVMTGTVQNRMGATFPSSTATWQTPHGEMKIVPLGVV